MPINKNKCKKMNVGIFTEVYLPQINGVITTICTLEKELKLLGHNVYIFTNYYPGYIDENPNVFRLPSVPFVLDKACRIGSFYSHAIMKEIKNIKLDVIHTNTEFSMGLFGRIVAKKLKIPVVHTYHTMYEDWINNSIGINYIGAISSSVVKTISKKHCNSCYKIIAPSNKIKETLQKYGIKKPIEIVSNGIDLSCFYKVNSEYNKEKINELKKELGLNVSDKIILNLGRQSKEKSVDVIIKSIPELVKIRQDFKFVIIGDGPYKIGLEKLAKDLNVKDYIIFLGKKPRQGIEKFFKIADLFVMTSLFEVQPVTVIESMAAKIPVIVKKDEAFVGIIENNITGFVFEKDEELASLINNVLKNEDLLKFISSNAFNKIENFSSINFSKNIERIYIEAVKNY